ncbi:MAG: hypothetical protein KKF80_03225, partial [Candidatus Omnitrophica bacterium]|nr:hypothetical protein [Candidatus Omnitrophota bacterium]
IILKNLDDLSPLFERSNVDVQPKLTYAKVLIEAVARTHQRYFYAEHFKIRDSREPACLAAS